MIKSLKAVSSSRFLLLTLVFLICTDLAILLDVPILRQVLGFLFLTFVPGVLILGILKLNKLGLTERIVLSVGLSVSLVIFSGLLINWIGPLLSYTAPLSTTSLLISFSIIFLILAVAAYLRSKGGLSLNLADFRLDTREKDFLILPVFFPLLSISGIYLMNTTGNNTMLMALLFLMPAYVILMAVMRRRVPDRSYPVIMFLIGISLLLMTILRCPHIVGSDSHFEYYFFQLTATAQHWQVFGNTLLDACLVTSLLPAIYDSLLNMDAEYLFKILHYFLFAISPLVVYIISRKYIGNFWAFLAAFFFMSQVRFLFFQGGLRNDIAILFFALAMMALFHEGLSAFNKRLLFIIFSATCIVSHYSAAYIFLFILLFTWLGMQVIPRIRPFRRKLAFSANSSTEGAPPNSTSQATPLELPLPRLKTSVTLSTVALFFAMLFLWYSQVTGVAFVAGVSFVTSTFRNLYQFFILESRSEVTQAAFGAGLGAKGIPQNIEFVISWLTIAFIAIGVLTTLARHHRMVAFPNDAKKAPPEFLVKKLDVEFFVLSLVCLFMAGVSAVLPYISLYGIARVYFQAMAVLSPFFIIGGIMVTRFLRTRWTYLMVLAILIPYFLCTTGVMYQLFGYRTSIVLNSTGVCYDRDYVHEQESCAAKWIGENGEEGITIYTDGPRAYRLISQGGIQPSQINGKLVPEYQEGTEIKGYIYLGYENMVKAGLVGPGNKVYSIAEHTDILAGKNKIYATNGSEIYR